MHVLSFNKATSTLVNVGPSTDMLSTMKGVRVAHAFSKEIGPPASPILECFLLVIPVVPQSYARENDSF